MNKNDSRKTENMLFGVMRKVFIHMGVLPFLIILATVIFALLSDNFLTVRNLTNVARQSTYLVIVLWARCWLCSPEALIYPLELF